MMKIDLYVKNKIVKNNNVFFKSCLMIVLVFVAASIAKAQEVGDDLSTARSTVYAEVMPIDDRLMYVVNYDYLFRNNISIRTGVSLTHFVNFGYFGFPVTTGYVFPLASDSFLEMNIGGFASFRADNLQSLGGNAEWYWLSSFGFRQQPLGEGVFTKIALVAFFSQTESESLMLTGTVGVGYSF